MTNIMTRSFRRATWAAAAIGGVLSLAACNVEVTNPGPIQASFLENKNATTALVNGAGRNLAEAINWTSYTGAAAARELFPGGSTGSFGITVRQQAGKLADDDGDTWWNLAQQARWTAEDGIKRVKDIWGADATKQVNLAQVLVWAGYANRHLGENFCDGVIDGSAKQAYTVYLDRAEANFTEAITVASGLTGTTAANLAIAATAGRASVRLLKNNLTGAVSMRKDVEPHPEHRDSQPDFGNPKQYVWVSTDEGSEEIDAVVKIFKEVTGK